MLAHDNGNIYKGIPASKIEMAQQIEDASEGDLELRTEQGMRCLIQFPVGDWSDDGHGKCNYYFAFSHKPTDEVREAHLRAREVIGFGIEEICGDYREKVISEHIKETLQGFGYEFTESVLDEVDGSIYPTTQEIFNIWLYLLNRIDSSLQLKEIKIPLINFYEREIKSPGYG